MRMRERESDSDDVSIPTWLWIIPLVFLMGMIVGAALLDAGVIKFH